MMGSKDVPGIIQQPDGEPGLDFVLVMDSWLRAGPFSLCIKRTCSNVDGPILMVEAFVHGFEDCPPLSRLELHDYTEKIFREWLTKEEGE